MFGILEYLFEIFYEFIIELLIQLLFLLGFRRITDVFTNTVVAALIFGTISGLVSLLFFSEVFITNPYMRVVNLFILPCIMGLFMMLLGRSYKKIGVMHSSMDSFASGFSFAMAMVFVRYLLG